MSSSSSSSSGYNGSLPNSPASPVESLGSPLAPLLSVCDHDHRHHELGHDHHLLKHHKEEEDGEEEDLALSRSSSSGSLRKALSQCDRTSLSKYDEQASGPEQLKLSQVQVRVGNCSAKLDDEERSPLTTINNNHLQPTAPAPPLQKVRSFSHIGTVTLPAANDSPSSTAHLDQISVSDKEEEQRPATALGAPLSLSAVERPRRPSRIENRQSLHELGYGRAESYFKLSRLGKGTYATVYMGRSRLNNDLVALKEILKEHDEGAPCTAIREVSLLRLLRHNNIVTLHDVCHECKKLTLVFEYVGPDLYAYMKENNHLLSIHNVRLLLYQLLRGISFCHSRQVLHRDLKPQNLLINSRGELKICDFGLARAKSIPTKSYSNEVVTLWYRPPDVLLGNTDYDHSIDMWGVGCIFYEMASGRTFFPGSNVRQQLYLIFSSLGSPSAYNWPEILGNREYLSYNFPAFRPEKLTHRVPRLEADGLQLLQSLLRFKPNERVSADEARRDPFFASLPEQVHHLNERESVFDVPGVYMTLNPGQKLSHHHNNHHNHYHHHHHNRHQQHNRLRS